MNGKQLLATLVAPITNMARGSKPPASTTSTTSLPPGTPPTATERDEILKEVRAFFEPRRVGGNTLEVEAMSPTPDESLMAICRALPELVTADELTELTRLNTEYNRGQEHLALLGRDRIRETQDAHSKEIGERLLAGQEVPDGFNKQDWSEDFAVRRQALKRAIGQRGLAAARIVSNVARRFIEHGTKSIEEIAIADYTAYRIYGVPYVASTLIRTLLCAIERAKTIAATVDRFEELAIHGGMLSSPATQCAPFAITLDRAKVPGPYDEERARLAAKPVAPPAAAPPAAPANSGAAAAEHKAAMEKKQKDKEEILRSVGREDMIPKPKPSDEPGQPE